MVGKTEQSLSPSLTLLVPVFVLLSDVITNAGSKLLTDKHQARRPGPATRSEKTKSRAPNLQPTGPGLSGTGTHSSR